MHKQCVCGVLILFVVPYTHDMYITTSCATSGFIPSLEKRSYPQYDLMLATNSNVQGIWLTWPWGFPWKFPLATQCTHTHTFPPHKIV